MGLCIGRSMAVKVCTRNVSLASKPRLRELCLLRKRLRLSASALTVIVLVQYVEYDSSILSKRC